MTGWSKKLRLNVKFPLLSIVIVLVAFEWLEYSLTPFISWPKLPQTSGVTILIVGDPQLLGNRFSAPSVFGHLCRWDADRYIKKTFSLAFNYVKPEIVLFLGDIFDEGEIATDTEFRRYFERFKNIFHEVEFNKAVIIPGDNDIGGEDQPPQPHMEKRFNTYFRDDVFIQHRFIQLIKVNYITHANHYEVVPNATDFSSIRIVLSHVPLTPAYSTFVSRVIPYLQPHIILSAHDHKSEHVIADRKTGIIVQTPSLELFSTCAFNVSDAILHEIMVPTCSYRMGTHHMGYGVLQVTKDGEILYNALWLPSRFRQLVICFVSVFLYFIFYVFKMCSIQKYSVGFV